MLFFSFFFAAVYQLENMLLSIMVDSGDGLNSDLDVEVSLLLCFNSYLLDP
jgi:hypothetical protein